MAAVRLVLPSPALPTVGPFPPHQKATFVATWGHLDNQLTVPYLDPVGDISNLSRDWLEQKRPGNRKPLTRAGSKKLTKVALTAVFADPADSQRDVEKGLQILRAMAASDQPLVVTFGGLMGDLHWTASGRWVINDLTIHVQARAHADNAITRAEASIDMLEANIPGWTPATSTGGLSLWAIPGAGTGLPATFQVSAGDTLWSIAWRLYGDPTRWRALGAANNVLDPRALTPGQVLRVP